jgi:RNA 3'-terminal phosphate cyclase (ATP)
MNLPAHVAHRMAARATNVLAGAGLEARVEPQRLRGAGPGAGIFLSASYAHTAAGFSAIGRLGLPSERVAEAACAALLAFHRSGAAVDANLADQLVLPMALADGASRVATTQVTSHLLTNAWVVRRFLPVGISVTGEFGAPGTLVVEGRGS